MTDRTLLRKAREWMALIVVNGPKKLIAEIDAHLQRPEALSPEERGRRDRAKLLGAPEGAQPVARLVIGIGDRGMTQWRLTSDGYALPEGDYLLYASPAPAGQSEPPVNAEFGDPRRAMTDEELQEFCISLSIEQDDYTEDVIRNVERRMLGQPLFETRVINPGQVEGQSEPKDEPEGVAHRQGCEALGGYGTGVGPCTCGATPQPAVSDDARDAARYRWAHKSLGWDAELDARMADAERDAELRKGAEK